MEKFPEDQYTEFIKENGSNIKNLSEYYYGSDSDYGIEMCDKFRIDDGYWYDGIWISRDFLMLTSHLSSLWKE